MNFKLKSLFLILIIAVATCFSFSFAGVNLDREDVHTYTHEEIEEMLKEPQKDLIFNLDSTDEKENNKINSRMIDFPNTFEVDVYWHGSAGARVRGKNHGIDPIDLVKGELRLYYKYNGQWKEAVKKAKIFDPNVPPGIEIQFASLYYVTPPNKEMCAILTVSITESGQIQTQSKSSYYTSR